MSESNIETPRDGAALLRRRRLLQLMAAGTTMALVPGVSAMRATAQTAAPKGGVLRVSAPFNPSTPFSPSLSRPP